jgi:hypothetical protein
MKIPEFTEDSCEAASACIIPSLDPSEAHDVIFYNLTEQQCKSPSLGVRDYRYIINFLRNVVKLVVQFVLVEMDRMPLVML